jgi:hypothetical protein
VPDGDPVAVDGLADATTEQGAPATSSGFYVHPGQVAHNCGAATAAVDAGSIGQSAAVSIS